VIRFASVLALCLAAGPAWSADRAGNDWYSYGGDAAGTHYSSLRQITPANVGRLREIWRYETADPGPVETTPLILDGVMYVVSARQKVTALDAATGRAKWTFDSGIGTNGPTRGLTWWHEGTEQRLFAAVASYLYAIDPADGGVIRSFGDDGRIDLRADLRGEPAENGYSATSPPVVYKDLLIVGGRVSETTPASPGDERAYDVRTGKLRWVFHTVPMPGEPGAETWPAGARDTQGGANAWAGQVVDTDRGIVFIATGSAADDFYGVNRAGNNLYADCVIALDATTGKKLWYFQAVHHDLWDSDFAGPPVLLTVNRGGQRIDAVAASNKPGYVYIFDRVTGAPLFPIVEQKVPASTVPGEQASPTQPIPKLPAPLARQIIRREELTHRTPALHAWAQNEYDSFLGTKQHFTPLSIDRTTLISPGWEGGVEWGGMTADPDRGILYANVNNIVSLGSLAEGASYAQSGQGDRTYQTQCMVCHGASRQGAPPAIPSLVDVGSRLSAEMITEVVRNGRGRMPAFPALPAATVTNLIGFLTTGKDVLAEGPQRGPRASTQYVFTGYRFFTDPDGYPAGPMPWGTLNAIDMNTGKYLWTVPYGQHPELAASGLADTGAESHGGSVLSATGVLFTGGSEHDLKFRAYDSASGRVLWEGSLPGHGAATPALYAVHGKQYVVIAASPARTSVSATTAPASRAGGGSAATYVVFALP
jgi:quinoprotein glucose dehydrogenase